MTTEWHFQFKYLVKLHSEGKICLLQFSGLERTILHISIKGAQAGLYAKGGEVKK